MNMKRAEPQRNGSARTEAGRARTAERGSSVLIILVLLACMAIMLAANSTAIALLKQEIQFIDRQQQQKYGQSAGH
jgi:hypothetical protein